MQLFFNTLPEYFLDLLLPVLVSPFICIIRCCTLKKKSKKKNSKDKEEIIDQPNNEKINKEDQVKEEQAKEQNKDRSTCFDRISIVYDILEFFFAVIGGIILYFIY